MRATVRAGRLSRAHRRPHIGIADLRIHARSAKNYVYGHVKYCSTVSRHSLGLLNSPKRQHSTCAWAAMEEGSTQAAVGELYLSDEEVDELISDAAGFICILDELRPLDPATFNPFYEVWTRIARIPPEDRYRLLDELEPGSLRSLWRASMARYVLDETRSLELFSTASVWDDFPNWPGQVYEYEGRCESYQLGGPGGAEVTFQRLERRGPGGSLSPVLGGGRAGSGLGGDAASAPATPWLRPHVGAWEMATDRFKQLFFVPVREGGGVDGKEDGGDLAGAAPEELMGAEPQQQQQQQQQLLGWMAASPRVYSRMVLPLAGPLDRWWEPLYSRLRVQLTLTPLSRDAGADLQLLYPEDPAAGAPADDGEEPPPAEAAGGGGWALTGPECLPSPALGALLRWPDPDPVTYGRSPLSGGPRDFMRVAGPGVYVGCAYRQGPAPGEYREENFVYFVIARRG